MKTFNLVALFIIGFILFAGLMDFIQIDLILEKNFINDNNIQPINSFLQVKSDSSAQGTILKPEDSKTPLKLTKEELGRHTWALLHSVAASYPSIPNAEQRKTIENFIYALADVYPCKICSGHFKEMLKEHPIKNKSREEFVYYLCDLHNKVNNRLGKPIYDCKKSFEIWGGDCGCEVDN
jgi:FAD-linked sulfhydryl oxidase